MLALFSLFLMAMGAVCITMSLSKEILFFLKPAAVCFILSGESTESSPHPTASSLTLPLPSTRGPGAPVRAGFPSVGPGPAGQRPHGASAPPALLVGVVRGLRRRRAHRGRSPLPAAGSALQPLAEVPAAQGQRQLVARRWRCTLEVSPGHQDDEPVVLEKRGTACVGVGMRLQRLVARLCCRCF